jgi:hypothetical protein
MAAVAAELLGLTFLAAGAGKLRSAQRLRVALAVLVPASLVRGLSMLVPAAELGLGALLLSGVAPRVAAALALGALGLFSAGLLVLRTRAPGADCGCFGAAPGRGSLGRNALLALGALAALLAPAEPWAGGAPEVVGRATVVVGLLCAWTTARALLALPGRLG